MLVLAACMWLKYLDVWDYVEIRTFPPLAMGTFLIGSLAGLRRLEAEAPSPDAQLRWARCTDVVALGLVGWAALAGVLALRSGRANLSSRVAVEATITWVFAEWIQAATLAGRQAYIVTFLCSWPLQQLGSFSYGVFCLQYPVWAWCAWAKGSSWGPGSFSPGESVVAMLAVLAAACAATYLVEEPVQRWLQRRLCVPVPPCAPKARGSERGCPWRGHARSWGAGPSAGLAARCGEGPEWSPETGRCLCLDPAADGDFSLAAFCALSCPCCIPRRECCCFNPFNPRAGCGSRFSDWRPPRAHALVGPPVLAARLGGA
uniref:Uncharacterized protein n=1 Tax=Zooxanthella nutricula TaxID=1333877 RepID=A0A7S2JXI0_9DINO